MARPLGYLDEDGVTFIPVTNADPLPVEIVGGGGGGGVSDTEISAAAALSDTLTNPSTGLVGACVLLWDNGTSKWVRAPGTVAAGQLVVATLAAGTAIAGKVGLDQTTPGTTNAVAIIAGQNGVAGNAGANGATVPRFTLATDDGVHTKLGEVQASPTANTLLGRLKDILTGIVLSAGAAIIGKVGIDQTTPGTTNNVSIISGQNGVAGGTGVDGATVQRVTLATNVGLPAGSTLIGKTSAGFDSSTVYNGTTALTPKFAVVNIAGSGATNQTLVAAVSSKKIRVLSFSSIVAVGQTFTATFKSATAGTAITGPMPIDTASSFIITPVNLPFNPLGHFETIAGELLSLALSDTATIGGILTYVEV